MKRFFFFSFIAILVFTNLSAGLIIAGPATSTVEESDRISPNSQKIRYQLSRKALRNMSADDMAKIMGREMTDREKADFKANRRKFVKGSGMAEVKQTNTLAIIAFVSSLILPPAGIVLGIIALAQIKKKGEDGKGWAIAGIVVGAVLTLYFVIMVAAWAVLAF
jgi:hypothetical protein